MEQEFFLHCGKVVEGQRAREAEPAAVVSICLVRLWAAICKHLSMPAFLRAIRLASFSYLVNLRRDGYPAPLTPKNIDLEESTLALIFAFYARADFRKSRFLPLS